MIEGVHPGYNFGNGDFSTFGNLKKYNEMHELDFVGLIRKLNSEEGILVDIGCGNGRFGEDLLKIFPRIRYMGVDRTLYKNNLPRGCFKEADAREISLDSGIADLVVSTSVSQWIYRRRENFYREAFRLLAEKGLGLIFPCGKEDIPQDIHTNYLLRTLYKGPFKVKANQLVFGNTSSFFK